MAFTKHKSVRVSHETIYAYVYGPDGQSKELARTCLAVARNGNRIIRAGPVALFSSRIARSMSDLTTSKPVRHLANGKAI